MDTDGSGNINYAEFTLLSEERWRNIDPFVRYKAGMNHRENFIKTSSERFDHDSESNVPASQMGVKVNDSDGLNKLESLAKEHLKIPVKKTEREVGFVNINRSDAKNYLAQSVELRVHGKPSAPNGKISNVLRHDYLRKSMVDRIERKALMNKYKQSAK